MATKLGIKAPQKWTQTQEAQPESFACFVGFVRRGSELKKNLAKVSGWEEFKYLLLHFVFLISLEGD